MRRRDFLGSVVGTWAATAGLRGNESARMRRFRFFLWNDMHVRDTGVPNRPPPYPFANEKAQWALECSLGQHGIEPPDFVLSAGDIIDGEIPDFGRDFGYLNAKILGRLRVPFMPCVGNHENEQGEGIEKQNVAYDQCFGSRWRNYLFTIGGIGFIVVDTSGAHRSPDEVTSARNAFVARAFDRLNGVPVIVVTHVPLIAMREEEPLSKSFGFSSWRVLDPGMLKTVDDHRNSVIAVLCGHLHLSGARQDRGIHHVVSSGTAGYPCDFTSLDVFDDRVNVCMHKGPDQWLDRAGDIHGKPRHVLDYTDSQHIDHERYVWGNRDERRCTIPLEGSRRPRDDGFRGLTIWHESAPGRWQASQRR